MNRTARRLFYPSAVTIALGASVSIYGIYAGSLTIWRAGLLAAVLAFPTLGYALTHRAAEASDDQLAHAHRAGYQLALYHVSQGLLDTPAAPPDGGEDVGPEDTQGVAILRDLPDNVRPIRGRDDEEDDNRKAV